LPKAKAKTDMIKALIFDFDGLILDTEGPEFQAWQEVYLEYGCELSLSTWSVCIGTTSHQFDPYQHLEILLGRPIDREQINAKRRPRNKELLAAQKTLPGVEDYLIEARQLGLKLGVASSAPNSWVSPHLTRLELLEYFDTIKTKEDVTKTKPDPQLYCLTLESLGVAASEAIAFEDSPNGVLAAKGAGIYCVAVPNQLTRQLSLEQADLQLNSLAELTLQKLMAQVISRVY
jgi:HAD superfamily hydrolase (TIGR01509 family)